MKTDFHCHILPGLDDGAQDIKEAVFLSRKLVEWGYTDAVCVAHSKARYRNNPQTVLRAYNILNDALQRENVNLTLHPSMEYRLSPEVWTEVQDNGWLLPWFGNHLLIEFPLKGWEYFGDLDPYDEVKKLLDDCYQPVLAHPERYHYLDMEQLVKLRELGCEFQANLGSVYGFYGDGVRECAIMIAQKGWYNYIGTDLHNRLYADLYDKIKNCK